MDARGRTVPASTRGVLILVLYCVLPGNSLWPAHRSGRGIAEQTTIQDMKEYQAVILRLSHRTRDDEDALTDLLNERSRAGWDAAHVTQSEDRLTVIFSRSGEN